MHVSISNNGLPMNFLSNKWIATYSFNYSNKTGFVNNDHYIVISHMVHYTCLNFKKKKCLPMNFLSNKWIYEPWLERLWLLCLKKYDRGKDLWTFQIWILVEKWVVYFKKVMNNFFGFVLIDWPNKTLINLDCKGSLAASLSS